MTKMKRIFSLALALILSLSLGVPAFAAETAANIQLTKTTGTVTVTKSNGKAVSIRADMRLYNGYNVTTAAKSYAWINLDSTKLMKLDASSSVEVRKNGTKLEVNVKSGSVSFDVSEKLGSGESLNVSTSTMAVGIRGTCGWVSVNDQWVSEVCLLEGSAQCVVTDPVTCQIKSVRINAGDTAQCVVYSQDKLGHKCDILIERQTTEGIPGFVLTDLVLDVGLCDRILEDSGIDVLADLAKIAGGDPSGRMPDGKSASPEVMALVKQMQAREEAQTAQKLEEIRKKANNQEHNISKDPVWEQGQQPDNTSSSGGSSGGTDPAPTTYTVTFVCDSETTTTQTTNTDHKLDALPDAAGNFVGSADPPFLGWYTAEEGGNNVTTDTVFTSDQTVYAQWDGSWILNTDTGRLTIFNDEGMNSGAATRWGNHWYQVKTVDICPDVTYIAEAAFQNCNALTSVTFTDDSKLTNIGKSAFVYCGRLTSITIPEGVTSIGESAFSDCTGLTSVTFADDSKLTNIDRAAFAFCESLTGVTIPKDVTSIGVNAFASCKSLTSVTIPEGVTSIAYGAFNGCSSLTSVTIPENVTSIGMSAFNRCEKLQSVTFTGNSKLDTIGDNAFSSCTSLASITIPNGVTSIGTYAFSGCADLTSITIPGSVKSISQDAFKDCTSLAEITIQDGVTSIGSGAFSGCDSVTSVTFGGTSSTWDTLSRNAGIPDSATVTCRGDAITP